jgi:glyoxylase-like metal-dependent hydrolase (beta-lactamase superfamily II)
MELKHLTDKIFYIPNTCNIGVIKDGDQAILIDSGLDDDTGRKILKCLEKEGLKPKTIINTHSHVDHIGGNAYLAEKAGANVFCPEFEDAMVKYTNLVPSFMFSGANPINELKNKFVMARPSKVDFVIERGMGELQIGNVEIGVVELPGHSTNHIGIEVEGVLFCGDAIMSRKVLNKHKILFCIDIKRQIETLENLKATKYKLYIPSHGEPMEDITSTVDDYIEMINEVVEYSLGIMKKEMTSADYLKALSDKFGINLRGASQYYLMNIIAMSYLSYLFNSERIKAIVKNNILYWVKL